MSCTPLILIANINFLNPYVPLLTRLFITFLLLFLKYEYDFWAARYCFMNFYGALIASLFFYRFAFNAILLLILFYTAY